MKITFLGTRGNIKSRNRRHFRHTATMITYKQKKVMIDCGIDWLNKVNTINPDAIVITHAHPDHAYGLKKGSPCPVYATPKSWDIIKRYPIEEKKVIKPRKKFKIGAITFEAFFVEHSLRAPGVGYRITAGGVSIFCVHDLISIPDQQQALKRVRLYIGDGASITRPIIRKKNGKRFGHTTIKNQLRWCEQEKIPRAIFTHCGSQIVEGDERTLGAQVRKLGREFNVQASIAHDGMVVIVRKYRR